MPVKKTKTPGSNVMFLEAIKALCFEREISEDDLFDAIEAALVVAYKKNFDTAQNVEVNIDRDTGAYHVYALKTVVEHVDDKITQISALDAHVLDPRYEIGDIVRMEVTPKNFGRIAATAAKQFVVQRVREIERGILFQEFSGKANDIVGGTVVRIEHSDVIVDIGKSEAILLPAEQLPNDTFQIGDHVRAYLAEVKKGSKGPQVYISRTHPGFLKKLFEIEVPEIADGIIEIKSVARDAGVRSKISVASKDENIDPVGACLGDKGIRVQAINNEIGNEKIDVIAWSEDPVSFVANAVAPAKTLAIAINENEKFAQVIVPDMHLSLAIGREGQNARLAARLTGWKIDIKPKSQEDFSILGPDFVITRIRKQKKKPKPAPGAKKVTTIVDSDGTVVTLAGGATNQPKKQKQFKKPFEKKPPEKKPFEKKPFDEKPQTLPPNVKKPDFTVNFFDDDDDD